MYEKDKYTIILDHDIELHFRISVDYGKAFIYVESCLSSLDGINIFELKRLAYEKCLGNPLFTCTYDKGDFGYFEDKVTLIVWDDPENDGEDTVLYYEKNIFYSYLVKLCEEFIESSPKNKQEITRLLEIIKKNLFNYNEEMYIKQYEKKYKMLVKEKVLPLPTDKYIVFVEEHFRLKFPENYRNFILEFNGGEAVINRFLFGGIEYTINRFFSILENYKNNALGYYDIIHIVNQFKERFTNPKHSKVDKIPIALLSGKSNDYLCLDFEKDNKNTSVCIWINYKSESFKPFVIEVANSYEEFIDMLY